jgi:alpha-L-rhamnosidase
MKSYYSLISLLLFSLLSYGQTKDKISIVKLLCNSTENPSVINTPVPQFSWKLTSESRNQFQSAYQILVADNYNEIQNSLGNIWDSGKMNSDKSILIQFNGKKLIPAQKYFWKVKVWNQEGNASEWSQVGTFQTGLFSKTDWSNAQWIGIEEMPIELKLVPGVHGNGDDQGQKALKRPVVPLFRKDFIVQKEISSATLFISGLGHYEAFMNGKKVGNSFLAPGWTDYEKTILYNCYDVTKMIFEGENAIGAIVGNGFYNINRERYRKMVIAYGMPKMICNLQIEYSDGSIENIISDNSWKTSPSPITFSSIYGGEDYDARLEQPNWNGAEFDDSAWEKVLLVRAPEGVLSAETDYPLKVMEVFDDPVIKTPEKTYLYDFKQNASGIVKLKVTGKKGQTLKLHPAERLMDNGLMNQKTSGTPYWFQYTLKGEGEEIWMPKFTYYGFRYVQVEGAVPEGYPNPENLPVITDLQLLHTRNSSPIVGGFNCSNELFNRTYELIDWSVKSNLASVTTDCPHREKMGWLEVTHLMGNSIKYNYDIYNLFDKIVDDMIESQTEDGLVPDIAPEYVEFVNGFRDSPEWGSSCVIVPWYLYKWYGDTQAMKKAFPMMKRYMEYLGGKADNHILDHGLGDWYDLGPKGPGPAQLTPKSLTATAIYYYDLTLVAGMAKMLGNDLDANFYSEWAEKVRIAFNGKFFNQKEKKYSTGSQTSYAMPLYFGMVDKEFAEEVEKNLAEELKRNNYALTSGDVGYRYLLQALQNAGYSDIIYRMNARSDVPGYGYQLEKGATSLTESWKAEGASHNHMMLGHLMEWFYSGMGGIGQSENSVAYKEITIKPSLIEGISHAAASYDSSYGQIKCTWNRSDNSVTYTVEIPVNTTAMIILENGSNKVISEGGKNISEVRDVEVISKNDGLWICKVGSGKYSFKIEN